MSFQCGTGIRTGRCIRQGIGMMSFMGGMRVAVIAGRLEACWVEGFPG